MKTLIVSIAAMLFNLNGQAQNKNVTQTSNSTVTTVKDSDGEKKMVKTQNVNEVQNVELENASSNALNKDVKASPVQVTASTTITAPDGSTRVVDVDRSAYYSLGGTKYQVAIDNTGYSVMTDNNKRAGVLRRLSNNSYIYKTGDKTSVGYFDANGNLVLETYDDKTDRITVETYQRN
jgi:hypothetical protein